MHRIARASSALALLLANVAAASADPPRPPPKPAPTQARICHLIDVHARSNGLPEAFLARLIWKESRFDPDAVSPAGAQGIAQFMPGTARMRRLDDAFDIERAIPASARYLAEMRAAYGNLGLAAIGYNAGETRLARWLSAGGFLPLETEDYVLDILGEPADNFSERGHDPETKPLDPTRTFGEACRMMRAIYAQTIAMATIATKPWGIQVAGNFRRAAAIGQWRRLSRRFGKAVAQAEPVVSRVRSARGRRGIYAVRIGADSRASANDICRQLRAAGGSCVVLRNR